MVATLAKLSLVRACQAWRLYCLLELCSALSQAAVLNERLERADVAAQYMSLASSPDCSWWLVVPVVTRLVELAIPLPGKIKRQLLGFRLVAFLNEAVHNLSDKLVGDILDIILFFDSRASEEEDSDPSEGEATLTWSQKIDAQALKQTFNPLQPSLLSLAEVKLADRMSLCLSLITKDFLRTLVCMDEAGVALMKAISKNIVERLEEQLGVMDEEVPETMEAILLVCRAAHALVDFGPSPDLDALISAQLDLGAPASSTGASLPQSTLKSFCLLMQGSPYFNELLTEMFKNFPAFKVGYPKYSAACDQLRALKLNDSESWALADTLVDSIIYLRQGVRKGATVEFEVNLQKLIKQSATEAKAMPAAELTAMLPRVKNALGKSSAFWKDNEDLKAFHQWLGDFEKQIRADSNMQILVQALQDCGTPFAFAKVHAFSAKLDDCNGGTPSPGQVASLESALDAAVNAMMEDFPMHSRFCADLGRLAILLATPGSAKLGLKVSALGLAAKVTESCFNFDALGQDLPDRLLKDDNSTMMSAIIRSYTAFWEAIAKSKVKPGDVGPSVSKAIFEAKTTIDGGKDREASAKEADVDMFVEKFSGRARGGKGHFDLHIGLTEDALDFDLFLIARDTLLKTSGSAKTHAETIDKALKAYRDMAGVYSKEANHDIEAKATAGERLVAFALRGLAGHTLLTQG